MKNITKNLLKNTLLFILIVNLTLDFNFAGREKNSKETQKKSQNNNKTYKRNKPIVSYVDVKIFKPLCTYLKANPDFAKLDNKDIKEELFRLAKGIILDIKDKHPYGNSCMECIKQAALKNIKEYKKMILALANQFPDYFGDPNDNLQNMHAENVQQEQDDLEKQAAGNKDIIFQSIENLKEKYKEEYIKAVDRKELPNMAKCVLLACSTLGLGIEESYDFITQYNWHQIEQEWHTGLADSGKSFFEYFNNNLLPDEAEINKFFDDLVFHDEAMKLMQHASSHLDFEETKNKEKGTFIIIDKGYSAWQQHAHINNNDPQKKKLSEMNKRDFSKMINENCKEAFYNFMSHKKSKCLFILSPNTGQLGLCGINQYINYLILNQDILYNAKISNKGFYNNDLLEGLKMVIQANNDLKRFKKSQSKKNRKRVMNDLKKFSKIYQKDLVGRILVAMSIKKRIDERELASFMQDTDNPHVLAELFGERSLISDNPFANILGYLCMEKPIFANSNDTHINNKYFYEDKENYLENRHNLKRITLCRIPGHTFYIDSVGNPFSPSCQLMRYDDNGNTTYHNFNKTRIIQKEIIENNQYSGQEKLGLLNFLRNLETAWIINGLY